MLSSALSNEQALTGDAPHAPTRLGVVLVAAGRGTRLGSDEPKAFVELHGRAIIEFGISVATSLPRAGHLVVVVPESHAGRALEVIEQVLPERSPWEVSVVAGGRERHESVRFGLDALPETVETVLVHDAARPFAGAELFERVISEVERTGDAVIPTVPVVDTLKRVDENGFVEETVARDRLVAVQTPQGFPRELLVAAHATAQLQQTSTGTSPTDDAEVVQRAGGTVRVIAGEQRAHKLTVPADLAILEHILTTNVLGTGSA
ncbi:2-C-methyl-D-erythritol 4-phosphate cytidylyltransferase [Leucobacter sp. GX24907]